MVVFCYPMQFYWSVDTEQVPFITLDSKDIACCYCSVSYSCRLLCRVGQVGKPLPRMTVRELTDNKKKLEARENPIQSSRSKIIVISEDRYW